MKQIFTRILFVLSSFVLFVALPAKAAPEKYTFDPTHSYVLWGVGKYTPNVGIEAEANKAD